MINDIKYLLKLLGIPYINSDGEADLQVNYVVLDMLIMYYLKIWIQWYMDVLN